MVNQANLKSELVKLSKSTRTAQCIFKALAERERDRLEPLDLRRFRKALIDAGIKVNDEDYAEAFKRMDTLGLGQIIYGARGGLYKFRWANINGVPVSPINVGQVAGGKDKPLTVAVDAPPWLVPTPQAVKAPTEDTIQLSFKGKSGQNYPVHVPSTIDKMDLVDLVQRLN